MNHLGCTSLAGENASMARPLQADGFVQDHAEVRVVTRFAPSPTGRLHIGHAYSALLGWQMARDAGGRFVLRIEDIDRPRCRPAFEAMILDDLAWLGIDWERPVWRQSERVAEYQAALDRLRRLSVVYPCFCTRSDIAVSQSAPQGEGGPAYPGTCRGIDAATRAERIAAEPHAWRLDIARAAAITGPLAFDDVEAGRVAVVAPAGGDVVVARRDIGVSYHLAVVVDDAAQGINIVVRGCDLFEATHPQRLLQALLGLPTPTYRHHRLVLGPDGRRLAKRADAQSLDALRRAGVTPAMIRAALMLPATPPGL